jgi:AraC-like DNA-binding protein
MKVDADLVQHFYYHLNEAKPIEVLHHVHQGHRGWFDMHYELEMGVVLSGQMRRSYDSIDIDLSAGDVWFCNMWEPHGFQITETPCEVIVFEIFPPLLYHKLLNYNWLLPFNSSVKSRPGTSEHDRDEVISITSKVKQELTSAAVDQIRLQLLMFQLIQLVTRNSPDNSAKIIEHTISSQHRIAPAMELVFQKRRFIPLEEAAQACAMSKNGFGRLFSKMMRTTFPKFALNYRIRGALHEHSHSDKKLEAIATDWGFTDASHLHKYLSRK